MVMCACVHVYACPCVVKRPLSLRVMERTERENGCEKAAVDYGVDDPSERSYDWMFVQGFLIGHLLCVTTV